MNFIFTIPLADIEIKTNAKTLVAALEEAKRFNIRKIAENPEFDYAMLQVEDLRNDKIYEVVTLPGENNRMGVTHTITEYDVYGNLVKKIA